MAIDQVRDLFMLKYARLITLAGPPGVGKTRLAMEVAQSIGAPLHDGVCFVDLSPVMEVEAVSPAITQALGITHGPSELEAFLEPREVLLVLDNFEQVLSAAPAIAELISACPRLRVLATSRERLGLRAERVFDVEPLPVPNSSQPLTVSHLNDAAATATNNRFSRHIGDTDATHIARICARLDGLLLAIDIGGRVLRLDECGSAVEPYRTRRPIATLKFAGFGCPSAHPASHHRLELRSAERGTPNRICPVGCICGRV